MEVNISNNSALVNTRFSRGSQGISQLNPSTHDNGLVLANSAGVGAGGGNTTKVADVVTEGDGAEDDPKFKLAQMDLQKNKEIQEKIMYRYQ